MRVVIISFNRANIIKKKTLSTLKKLEIPANIIDIVVETEALKEEYEKTLDNPFYTYIVSNTKGLGDKRNFVRWYYQYETNETEILQLDDDLDDIGDAYLGKDFNLLKLCEKAFNLCRETGACFWGISDYSNIFYIKNSKPLSTSLKMILGGFSGLLIDRLKEPIFCDCDNCEDVQFSCEHFLRDGKVLRFNHVFIKTKPDIPIGGMAECFGGVSNRFKNYEETCEYIYSRYAPMVRWVVKKNKKLLFINTRYKNGDSISNSI